MSAAPAVPELASPPGGTGNELPPGHVVHREQMQAFVLAEADPWHREHLSRLYDRWHRWNAAHFDGGMILPYILLSEPSTPRRLGDTSRVSGFGGRSQIRLRPSLLTGAHPAMVSGSGDPAGRFLVVADVLLHEMVHQWQQEVIGAAEAGYHGHGPTFRDRANRIGCELGLPPVRTMKARGRDRERPSCAQWPHNVRPADYYLGAYIEDVPTAGDDEGDPVQDPAAHCRTCTCFHRRPGT